MQAVTCHKKIEDDESSNLDPDRIAPLFPQIWFTFTIGHSIICKQVLQILTHLHGIRVHAHYSWDLDTFSSPCVHNITSSLQ